MGKKSKPPPQPDPYQVAAAQSAADKEVAITEAKLNRVNYNTPEGSVRWDGSTYYPTQTITLSPNQQGIFDAQEAISQQLHDQAGTSVARIPGDEYNTAQFEVPGLRGKEGLADAYYKRATDRMGFEFDQQRKDLERSLYNRGIDPSNERAGIEMDRLAAQQNESLERIAGDADMYADNRQMQLYQADTDKYGRDVGAYKDQRYGTFNEAATYLTGAPVFNQPQQAPFVPSQLPNSTLSQNVYASNAIAQQQWQQQQANRQGLFGGLLGLGGAIGGGILGNPGLFT